MPAPSESSTAICKFRNVCDTSDLRIPPCGTFENQLAPVLLAEEICFDALEAEATRLENQLAAAKLPHERRQAEFLQAGSYLELGLHKDTAPGLSRQLLGQAKAYLTRTGSHPPVGDPQICVESQRLLAQWPLFEVRAEDLTPSADMLQTSMRELAAIHHRFAGWTDSTLVAQLNSRLVAQLLLAREDTVAYTATPRENGLNRQGMSTAQRHLRCHPSYVIIDDKKLPVISLGHPNHPKHGTLERINAGLYLSELAQAAESRHGDRIFNYRRQLVSMGKQVVGWLADELEGRTSRRTVRILDTLSATAIRTVYTAADTHLK